MSHHLDIQPKKAQPAAPPNRGPAGHTLLLRCISKTTRALVCSEGFLKYIENFHCAGALRSFCLSHAFFTIK